MAKKCIICEEGAEYSIKGISEYYCQGCAAEHFSDIDVLEKLGEDKLVKD